MTIIILAAYFLVVIQSAVLANRLSPTNEWKSGCLLFVFCVPPFVLFHYAVLAVAK